MSEFVERFAQLLVENVGICGKICAITCGNVGICGKICAITCGKCRNLAQLLAEMSEFGAHFAHILRQCAKIKKNIN